MGWLEDKFGRSWNVLFEAHVVYIVGPDVVGNKSFQDVNILQLCWRRPNDAPRLLPPNFDLLTLVVKMIPCGTST